MDTNVNNTIVNSWSTQDIQQLITYVNEVRNLNDELRAHLILTEQKLKNEEAKVRMMQHLYHTNPK